MRIPVLAVSLSAGLASAASAHPHIFVDATAGFRFDEAGQLAGLRITWTYDAFTSLVMFDQLQLDADRDGALDESDRAAIVAGETEWPPDYNGDVYLDIDGTPVAMGRPQDGKAWMEDGRISVTFDLPLASPMEAPDGVRLRLYDPFYYYAYTMVALDETDMGDCVAQIDPFELDDASRMVQVSLFELGREEIPEQEDVGALFADEVHLTCG